MTRKKASALNKIDASFERTGMFCRSFQLYE